MKLADKVAIVTGATQGIGLACAERLMREGARVMLVDIKPEGAAGGRRSWARRRASSPPTSARKPTSTP